MKLKFCCVVPAERGGRTPLADCRKVYNRLTPEVRDKFAKLGVMYIRDIPEAELADVFGSSEVGPPQMQHQVLFQVHVSEVRG